MLLFAFLSPWWHLKSLHIILINPDSNLEATTQHQLIATETFLFYIKAIEQFFNWIITTSTLLEVQFVLSYFNYSERVQISI